MALLLLKDRVLHVVPIKEEVKQNKQGPSSLFILVHVIGLKLEIKKYK